MFEATDWLLEPFCIVITMQKAWNRPLAQHSDTSTVAWTRWLSILVSNEKSFLTKAQVQRPGFVKAHLRLWGSQGTAHPTCLPKQIGRGMLHRNFRFPSHGHRHENLYVLETYQSAHALWFLCGTTCFWRLLHCLQILTPILAVPGDSGPGEPHQIWAAELSGTCRPTKTWFEVSIARQFTPIQSTWQWICELDSLDQFYP